MIKGIIDEKTRNVYLLTTVGGGFVILMSFFFMSDSVGLGLFLMLIGVLCLLGGGYTSMGFLKSSLTITDTKVYGQDKDGKFELSIDDIYDVFYTPFSPLKLGILEVQGHTFSDVFLNGKELEEVLKPIATRNSLLRDQPKEFYLACEKQGIRSLDSESARAKATLIAKQMGYPEGDLDTWFEKSKAKALAADMKKEQERLAKLRKSEEEEERELTKFAKYKGREKRIAMIKELMIPHLQEIEKQSRNVQIATGVPLQKEHDWAVAGGIAQGIAGPAAGVVTALNTQAKNEEIRSQNAKNLYAAAQVYGFAKKRIEEQEKEIAKINARITEVEVKLIDESLEASLMDFLDISSVTTKISETGAVTVTASVKKNKKVIIYDNVDAIIDGTIAAELYQSDKFIGTALLVFPMDGMGSGKLSGICLCHAKQGEKVEVKFRPYHLWAMEK